MEIVLLTTVKKTEDWAELFRSFVSPESGVNEAALISTFPIFCNKGSLKNTELDELQAIAG